MPSARNDNSTHSNAAWQLAAKHILCRFAPIESGGETRKSCDHESVTTGCGVLILWMSPDAAQVTWVGVRCHSCSRGSTPAACAAENGASGQLVIHPRDRGSPAPFFGISQLAAAEFNCPGLCILRAPALGRQSCSQRRLCICAAAAPRWPQPLEKAKQEAAEQFQMAIGSVRSFWSSQRKWLKTWYVKLLASVALVVGVATAVTNIWGVRVLNHSAVPSATVSVSRLLDREVCLCSCHQS